MVKWKIGLDNYLIRLAKGTKLNLVYWSYKLKKKKSFTYTLSYEYPIKIGIPHIEPINYYVLGGLVIMNMYIDHVYLYKNKYNSIIGNNVKNLEKKIKL